MRTEREEEEQKIAALQARLRGAAPEERPVQTGGRRAGQALAMAWRLSFELVACLAIAAAMGYGLDWLFGTLPLFLFLMLIPGMGAAVITIMRTGAQMGAGGNEQR